jgi:two-component system OmpR family response regulator
MEFTAPKRIFIIDDDPMLGEALSDYLTRKTAHEVTVFTSVEEALGRMSRVPEIIILDYFLNSVNKNAANGLEVLDAIRKGGLDVPVIMLSGQEHYGVAIRTIQRGALEYVIKDESAFEKIAHIVSRIR